VAAPAPTVNTAPSPRITPLRDAAAVARSSDRPRLNRPVRADSEPGPLRSILTAPRPVEQPDRPTPLRSLLEAIPTLIDPLPDGPLPVAPVPTAPAPGEVLESVSPAPVEPAPVPEQDSRPSVRETVGSANDTLTPGDDNVAGHDPALLRRQDR
jgi:hypothetical protein